MFAALGDIIFLLLTSPEELQTKTGYGYAEHHVVEAPPLLQWTGDDLETISLTIQLHASFVNPTLAMILLYANAQNHLALPFVYGNGIFRGFYIIESIEEKHIQAFDDGTYFAMTVQLELKEWVLEVGNLLNSALSPVTPAAPPPAIVNTTSSGSPAPLSSTPAISAANALPASAISTLSNLGVPPGVTYSTTAYSAPGISALIGKAPPASLTPGNPDSVPLSVIVRAG